MTFFSILERGGTPVLARMIAAHYVHLAPVSLDPDTRRGIRRFVGGDSGRDTLATQAES